MAYAFPLLAIGFLLGIAVALAGYWYATRRPDYVSRINQLRREIEKEAERIEGERLMVLAATDALEECAAIAKHRLQIDDEISQPQYPRVKKH